MTLTEPRITIGRLAEFNTIVLLDPQQLVSRVAHCLLEQVQGRWWLSDDGSTNGTYIRRGTELIRLAGRQSLTDGMVICILGLRTDAGEEHYWELTFRDPNKTRTVKPIRRAPCLKLDFLQQRFYLIINGSEREINGLRTQEIHLLEYMASRNRQANDVSVLCKHEELIEAIWDNQLVEDPRNGLAKLVRDIRRKLGTPHVIVTEHGLGYRLITCPDTRQ